MKVLIVDDEPAIITMYRTKLLEEGFEVVVSEDGEEAIARAKADRPDVILLDLIMPKVNGLDVLKALKADPTTEHIPVYLLTNIPEESGGGKGKDLGATGYLFKADTEPQALVTVLKRIKKESQDSHAD